MDIIADAFRLAAAVARYSRRVRRFFFEVMLSDHKCTQCGGNLAMVGESRCQCRSCSYSLDPTVAFQRCPDCGGVPELRLRRYQCRGCGNDVSSRFVFEGLVFDAEYFRKKMAESRRRKQERSEKLKLKITETRSTAIEAAPMDFEAVPGLIDALDGLTAKGNAYSIPGVRQGFDLNRYQRHIQAQLEDFEVCFDDIPPLEENPRKDRIWRFIAMIFMAHAGLLEIDQEGRDIMVSQVEVNGKRCGIPG